MKDLGRVVWFTGLSGAGKSTLCAATADALRERGYAVQILDGDQMRKGLSANLGFSEEDRTENVRRIAHVADLLAANGILALVALISPLRAMRDIARAIVPDLLEIFVEAPLETCEARDPKGLYRRARSGQIANFTGIDSPFEAPLQPDLVCHTAAETVVESVPKGVTWLGGEHLGGQDHSTPARRPTIAVDFDGVIADYQGWVGRGNLGSPREDVRQALEALRGEGWKIVINSTRSESELRTYLTRSQVPFDEINRNSDYVTLGHKPVATVYWDDRAVTYSGDASRDLNVIRTFRTWNQRM